MKPGWRSAALLVALGATAACPQPAGPGGTSGGVCHSAGQSCTTAEECCEGFACNGNTCEFTGGIGPGGGSGGGSTTAVGTNTTGSQGSTATNGSTGNSGGHGSTTGGSATSHPSGTSAGATTGHNSTGASSEGTTGGTGSSSFGGSSGTSGGSSSVGTSGGASGGTSGGTSGGLPAMPLACDQLAATFGPDGQLYAFCGFNGTSDLGQMAAYSPTSNSWGAVSALPTGGPLSNYAAVTGPDGRIYLIGGWDGTQRWATLEAYDVQTKTWTTLAPMSAARDDVAAAVGPDGRLYAFGGWTGTAVLQTAEAYDIATGTWATLAAMPTARRAPGAAVGADGRLYVIGGETATAVSSTYTFTPVTTVEAYDLDAGWIPSTALPQLPVARSWAVTLVDQHGSIFVVDGDGPTTDPVAEVDVLGAGGTTWGAATALNPPLANAAGGLGPDGLLYVVGGLQNLTTYSSTLTSYSEACVCWQ